VRYPHAARVRFYRKTLSSVQAPFAYHAYMNKGFLALALALSVLPTAALADNTTPSGAPPSPPSAAQRQAMFKTMQAFGQQERSLRQATRLRVLESLSALHRTAIANLIGQLAISTNPDPKVTAKQIDALLSPAEQQRIVALHADFRAQSEKLRQELRAQLQSEFPALAERAKRHDWQGRAPNAQRSQRANDAGSLLLETLIPHHRGFHMMFAGHGPAPQQQ
jgi:hypothetical protein